MARKGNNSPQFNADDAFKATLALALIDANCACFMAWGTDCEAWHDALDDQLLARHAFGAIPDERRILTTWHDGEPLDEVMWFCKHAATHPAVEMPRTVLLHLARNRDGEALLQRYRAA